MNDEHHGDTAQPLVAHLLELRNRLLRAVVAVLVVFLCLFYFSRELYTLIAAPLMQALVRFGPVPVSVDAGSWHLYKGGVWDKCNEKEPTLDHAVNLVG